MPDDASDAPRLRDDDELWGEFLLMPDLRAAGIRQQALLDLGEALPGAAEDREQAVEGAILQVLRDRQRRIVRGECERQLKDVMDQERAVADGDA